MIYGDMARRMAKARERVDRAIALHGGTTLLATGITGDDARMARAAVDAGAKLLEPNHPAVALARGHKGVTNMDDAEEIRHEIPLNEMAEVTRGVREVVGDDIYITVGVPGGFTEIVPTLLTEEDFKTMAVAGADGLHVHKSNLNDLEQLVEMAHRYGLLVDAYIGRSTDKHAFGIPADTLDEVRAAAREMEKIGVDFIGLMTGMSYEGVAAGDIPKVIKDRLEVLIESVNVPTLAEGGINTQNYKAFNETGVNILVVGTAFDDICRKAVADTVKTFLE